MGFNLEELKNITVLYVEDEDDIRKTTSQTLDKLFKKIYLASNGEEGLDVFNQHKSEIDIIVSDINMPKKDGLAMVSDILLANNIPVIITTAYTDEKFLLKAIDIKIDKYITKPIKLKELTLQIAKLVKKNKKNKNLKQAAITLVTQNKEISEEKNELKLNKNEMEKELKLLRLLCENYISKIKIDKKAIITDVSKKFCKLYDYTKEEVIGQNINFIQDEDSANDLQKYMLEAIHEKKSILATHNFKIKNGQTLKFNININPKIGHDGYIDNYTIYQDLLLK